jgi:hypothetical protein
VIVEEDVPADAVVTEARCTLCGGYPGESICGALVDWPMRGVLTELCTTTRRYRILPLCEAWRANYPLALADVLGHQRLAVALRRCRC